MFASLVNSRHSSIYLSFGAYPMYYNRYRQQSNGTSRSIRPRSNYGFLFILKAFASVPRSIFIRYPDMGCKGD